MLSLQTIHILKYILGVKAWIFFNESSILVFVSNLSFYLNMIKLTINRKIIR